MKINMITFVIYVILIFLNVYYGFKVKNNTVTARMNSIKLNLGSVLAFVTLFFLVIIASLDTNNPDYNPYKIVYNGSLDYDVGFTAIQDFFIAKGVEYQTFRTIVFSFSYLCVFIFLLRININPSFSVALYSIYPFFYDAIQMRNLLAFSVILPFIPSLKKKSKKGIILFIVAVLIATSIHKISFVYILLLLVALKNGKLKRRLLIVIFSLSLLFLALCKISPFFNSLLYSLFENLTNDRRIVFIERGVVHFGFLLYIVMEGLYLLSSFYASKVAIVENCNTKNLMDYSSFILEINIIICCTFPVFLINAEFYRIFRNIAIINYFIPIINLTNFDKCKKASKNYITASMWLFLGAFLLNWLYQTNVDTFERVFWVFFD